jgi:beta-lactamase class A
MELFNKYKHTITFILLFLVGGIGGWFARIHYTNSLPSKSIQVREYSRSNDLINPLLYNNDLSEPSPSLDTLHTKLNDYIQNAKNNQQIASASVYFRYLNSNDWTGVNENEMYKPSSMLKILVMMSYYVEADQNPKILEKKLLYTATEDPGQYYKPEHELATGYYTVQELINAMIIYSDNEAAAVLTANNPDGYINLFTILKLPFPANTSAPNTLNVNFMSPKLFSIVFRTLYNATYISHFMSENALGLLTATTFDAGLKSSLPKNVVVAHKFGEYTEKNPDGSASMHELHDCGIVYHPNNPYLLCVMTKGKDFSQLQSAISNISSITYNENK